MIRNLLLQSPGRGDVLFRWRGNEVSRLEGFSDAAFAFAITLLVVSLEVPRGYNELLRTMLGFPAFMISFAIVVFLWYYHYLFFRRYGLQTATVIVLNSLLIFVVLLYIYPLKFLFNYLIGFFFDAHEGTQKIFISRLDASNLLIIYSAGLSAIFLIYLLMYRYAYTLRDQLRLNDVEVVLTKAAVETQGIYLGVSLASIVLALFSPLLPLAGFIYILFLPLKALHGYTVGRRIKKLDELKGLDTNVTFRKRDMKRGA